MDRSRTARARQPGDECRTRRTRGRSCLGADGRPATGTRVDRRGRMPHATRPYRWRSPGCPRSDQARISHTRSGRIVLSAPVGVAIGTTGNRYGNTGNGTNGGCHGLLLPPSEVTRRDGSQTGCDPAIHRSTLLDATPRWWWAALLRKDSPCDEGLCSREVRDTER